MRNTDSARVTIRQASPSGLAIAVILPNHSIVHGVLDRDGAFLPTAAEDDYANVAGVKRLLSLRPAVDNELPTWVRQHLAEMVDIDDATLIGQTWTLVREAP